MPDRLTSAEEQRLVALARQGDRRAFDELYRAHHTILYGYLRMRTETDADAEDLLQDTAIRAYERLDRYAPHRAPFIGFLKMLARDLLIGYWTGMSDVRRPILVGDLAAEDPEAPLDEEAFADRLARSSERAAEATEESIPLAVILALLELVLTDCGPPHQVICFGHVHLLAAKPAALVAHSDRTLLALTDELETTYAARRQIPPKRLATCFGGLRQRLALTVEDNLDDPRLLKHYAHFRQQRTAETTLAQYFTTDRPAQNISSWIFSVKRTAFARAVALEIDVQLGTQDEHAGPNQELDG